MYQKGIITFVILALCGLLLFGCALPSLEISIEGDPIDVANAPGFAETDKTSPDLYDLGKNAEEGYEVGNLAPDFTFQLLSGESASLSDYAGKVILLNVWATWCPPCVGEMPDLQKLQDQYGEDIQVVAINAGEDAETVQDFVDQSGLTFTIGLDEDFQFPYPAISLPTTYIIDPDGVIRKIQLGSMPDMYVFYAPIVDALLAEQAS